MSHQYLLPCSCGQKVRVDAAQAGGRVACVCGKELAVPTFRNLKQLEPAPLEQAGPVKTWSPVQGAIFSTGLFAALVAAIVAGQALLQYRHAARHTADPTPAINHLEGKQIDHLPADQLLAEFRDWERDGLGTPETPDWIAAQKIAGSLRTRAIIAAVVGAAGILAAIAATLVPPRASS